MSAHGRNHVALTRMNRRGRRDVTRQPRSTYENPLTTTVLESRQHVIQRPNLTMYAGHDAPVSLLDEVWMHATSDNAVMPSGVRDDSHLNGLHLSEDVEDVQTILSPLRPQSATGLTHRTSDSDLQHARPSTPRRDVSQLSRYSTKSEEDETYGELEDTPILGTRPVISDCLGDDEAVHRERQDGSAEDSACA
jgi:hypothetical protein